MPAKGNVIFGEGGDQVVVGGAASVVDVEPRKDVDYLVQEIKENLKLGHYSHHHHLGGGGGGKASRCHRGGSGSHRASPYAVPPSSRAGVVCDSNEAAGAPQSAEQRRSELKRWNHQRRRYPSTCMAHGGAGGKSAPTDDPFEMLQELISDGSLIKEAVRRLHLGLTPKYNTNRSFYDSDEECRTPPDQIPAAGTELEVGGGIWADWCEEEEGTWDDDV